MVDDGVASSSALSCSSWFSVKPDCFMPDAIFKTRTGGIEHFERGSELQKGSQVVAGDDETILEVCEKPRRSFVCRPVPRRCGSRQTTRCKFQRRRVQRKVERVEAAAATSQQEA